VFKFYNYPTVNEYGIIVLLRQILMYVRKREDFERKRREKEN